MLAHLLHRFSPFLWEFSPGWGIRWYGLAYVLAFLLGYALYHWLSKRGYNEVPPAKVGDFITWAAIFGVMVGGRLGYALFYTHGEIFRDPLSIFRVWEGGMSSHGGILGLVLFTLFFARRHHISWTSIGDSLVCVAPVGLFLVRCANFINGELWGKPAPESVWWGVRFPQELEGTDRPPLDLIRHDPEVRNRLAEILPIRHPSQLYEAALEGVFLFLVLWILRTRFRVPRGILTGVFFVLYAILRYIGEIFREPDPAWHWGPFSAGQALSFGMPILGLCFIVWGLRVQQYEPIFRPGASKGPAAS